MCFKFTYWLPDGNGEKQIINTDANAIIFIGANGAGKSRLGAWIEQQNTEQVHRIGAQRSLNFVDNIPLKSYRESEEFVMFGNSGVDSNSMNQKLYKYGSPREDRYVTHFFDDFNYVLSALIAKSNNENTEFVASCRRAEARGEALPHTPETEIDRLKTIWEDIFPQRRLHYSDSHFYAIDPNNDNSYSATKMSDGERSVLYFIAQVLCVPEGKIILIDEPELHLHKSLMNRLWEALEKYRSDCLFIYITHDTQFASLHVNARKYWIRNYSGGEKWLIEEIEGQELPENLLIDLLGNRKNILFVEGECGSFDSQIYSLFYDDYYIVPCGSCSQVIARTKAFNNTPVLHYCKAFGIIDRDFRSDYEIEEFKKDSIFTIAVAEVENLFIVEEVIRAIAKFHGLDEDEVFQKIKNYVIEERFDKQIESQICQAVVSEIKYRLGTIDVSKKNEIKAKETLERGLETIDFESIKLQMERKFKAVKDSYDYGQVIYVFNEKGISKSIGHFMSIVDKEYCNTVCAMLRNGTLNIEELFGKYMPSKEAIPRQ